MHRVKQEATFSLPSCLRFFLPSLTASFKNSIFIMSPSCISIVSFPIWKRSISCCKCQREPYIQFKDSSVFWDHSGTHHPRDDSGLFFWFLSFHSGLIFSLFQGPGETRHAIYSILLICTSVKSGIQTILYYGFHLCVLQRRSFLLIIFHMPHFVYFSHYWQEQ